MKAPVNKIEHSHVCHVLQLPPELLPPELYPFFHPRFPDSCWKWHCSLASRGEGESCFLFRALHNCARIYARHDRITKISHFSSDTSNFCPLQILYGTSTALQGRVKYGEKLDYSAYHAMPWQSLLLVISKGYLVHSAQFCCVSAQISCVSKGGQWGSISNWEMCPCHFLLTFVSLLLVLAVLSDKTFRQLYK